MPNIIVAVTLDSTSWKKDRSVAIRATTNTEITPQEYVNMATLTQQEGWLIFSPNENDLEIPEEPATGKEKKTKAQRLRGVMWHLWQKTDQSEDFDMWYDRRFEALLDKYKALIDD